MKMKKAVKIPTALLTDPDIHASTLRLWGILSLYGSADGQVTISLNRIAEVATFLSQRQALVQMKTLERLGLVDVVRGDRTTPNMYTLRHSRKVPS